ncbi:ABC transporter, ATP-binding protein [Bifidobacterium boum]|uniref:ABC transporter, ATP-binding protein n=2 Tax=Bifidobacterium boum TaxID=78343 RepID=A0A086ZI68_9BIFI|nr:ABC transporter, ATP-binding protein [Bifidobacterium boum]
MAWLASPPPTANTDASIASDASAVPDASGALATPAPRTARHNGTHPASERPMIEVRNLRKEYVMGTERVIALDRINLDIARGQICCIYGESGSGKSTLLNQLAGMERPTRGGVRIGGIVVSRLDERELAEFRQKHIGFVFQSYNLLPGLNAVENVAMPLMFRGVPREEREARARAMLRRVGLGKSLNHYPSQMSGGQQQRVGIARAFVTRPQVVFADEPTGNLDSKTKVDIMDMIRDFARENGQTIVLVTHDDHMAAYADRIVTLLDGRIVHDTEQDR